MLITVNKNSLSFCNNSLAITMHLGFLLTQFNTISLLFYKLTEAYSKARGFSVIASKTTS